MEAWKDTLEFYGKLSGTMWVWSMALVAASVATAFVGSTVTVILFVVTSLIWWSYYLLSILHVARSLHRFYNLTTAIGQLRPHGD